MVREPGGTLLRLRLENGERLVRVDGLIGRQELELRPLETGRHPAGVVARATVEAGGSALVVDLAQAVNGRVERALTGEPAAPVALVADDSIGARRAVCRVLEREGWRAVEARDGLEAWELLGSVIPALLLIDLDLGLLDPVQVIRAAQDQHGIPVVALASRDDPARRHELQALGVDAVLTKPVDEDGLAATLALLTPVAHRR